MHFLRTPVHNSSFLGADAAVSVTLDPSVVKVWNLQTREVIATTPTCHKVLMDLQPIMTLKPPASDETMPKAKKVGMCMAVQWLELPSGSTFLLTLYENGYETPNATSKFDATLYNLDC